MTPTNATLWSLAAGILPVFAFLAALAILDTFKLVRPASLAAAVAFGGFAALACYQLSRFIDPNFPAYPSFGAPWPEEVLKSAWILYLIRTRRVAFMVDAAICGFAVGAGFALVENLTCLPQFLGSGLAVWILRGFGTAIMHGGTTAIVGIVAIAMRRFGPRRSLALGFLCAVAIHTAWDAALLPPLYASLVVVLGLPPMFVFIFVRSERSLHIWMGRKLDKDLELLQMLQTGTFLETPPGRYLQSLHTFPPAVLGDMVCMLQLSSEISATAKGNLIRRSAGLPAESDPELNRKLTELDYLGKSLGLAGRHALAPLLSLSSRDRWELLRLTGSTQV